MWCAADSGDCDSRWESEDIYAPYNIIIRHVGIHGKNRGEIIQDRVNVCYDSADKTMRFTLRPTKVLPPSYTWVLAIIKNLNGIYDNFHCIDGINVDSEIDVDDRGYYILNEGSITLNVRVKTGAIPKNFSVRVIWIASNNPDFSPSDYEEDYESDSDDSVDSDYGIYGYSSEVY